ncbi:hypothetical protein V5O48_001555 [Marasmius crinis-equi]|uniref:Uncharacterized protein n=1 Tax=Marasmius crinis-equi TaxID=585013 RepID=A0ABR3FYA6_9AGAR
MSSSRIIRLLAVGIVILSHYLYLVEGVPQMVFVDDEQGDSLTGAPVSFLPSEAGFSKGPSCHGCSESWCQGCSLQPDPSKAHGGTWSVSTHSKGDATAKYLTFDFVGTEVTVYCILPNLPSSSNIISQYWLDFRIDDILPPSSPAVYNHASDGSGTYMYNASVFHQAGLTNEKHTMMVRMMPVPDIDAVMLFDYATYVFDDGKPAPPTTSTSVKTPSSITKPTSIPSTSINSSTASTTGNNTTTTASNTTAIVQNSSTTSLLEPTNGNTTARTPNFPPTFTSPIATSPATTTTQQQDIATSEDRQKRLAVILGSVFGGLIVIAIVGAIIVYRSHHRIRTSSGRDNSVPRSPFIRPFTSTFPSIPKSREKAFFVSNPGSESMTHLTDSDPVETDVTEEESPPDYSQRGFPL